MKLLLKRCGSCGVEYKLENVRVDDHWNKWTTEPAFCYCPHCDAKLDGVHPDSIDLAKHLTPTNVIIFIGLLIVFLIGTVTNTLLFSGTSSVIGFGLWLAAKSTVKDHRIIGWLLVGIAVTIFGVVAVYV
ncbi:hypothetical protein H8K52_13010 [Undibacterium seohonense]|jgi:hypothetical protein|uniref:Uncharacterized protein n=1 Tax=Undibacterium seohonense TaxID=1344950 RepID=A0ABR6X5W3_9BURK|nr:hypothetical protein [Undibacterium seohonense]MBC3808266.1 hypothetical protein [Undibacterium seohonense]